jgi:hypothetical protein
VHESSYELKNAGITQDQQSDANQNKRRNSIAAAANFSSKGEVKDQQACKERCGLGFELFSVVPNVPKIEGKDAAMESAYVF